MPLQTGSVIDRSGGIAPGMRAAGRLIAVPATMTHVVSVIGS